MLTRTLNHDKSAVGRRLKKFGLALRASPPFLSRANQLIFLCGANRETGIPSARREAIKRFIETMSDDYRVIYAESVFAELMKMGHRRNALDLEHEISALADKIFIVLESPSAFCELGAFAHHSLREKLVIINDSHFKPDDSFINTGPIAAAAEAKAPILWYPMAPTGIHSLDGIGATFMGIKEAIDSKPLSGSFRVPEDLSELTASKISLYFVHDLVLIAGPLSHEELVTLLISTFGKKNFDMLKHLLGVLRAANLIRSYDALGTWVYRSVGSRPFMRYSASVHSLMASFRRFHLRVTPERFPSA
ncbi:MAG: retron St85 family effector protein [Rhodocyclaceae bacterium]